MSPVKRPTIVAILTARAKPFPKMSKARSLAKKSKKQAEKKCQQLQRIPNLLESYTHPNAQMRANHPVPRLSSSSAARSQAGRQQPRRQGKQASSRDRHYHGAYLVVAYISCFIFFNWTLGHAPATRSLYYITTTTYSNNITCCMCIRVIQR